MAVKLILTEPVEHLGSAGDIVKVAPGYARNFLLPRKVALEATAGNLKMLENKRKVWKEQESKEVGAAEALRDHLQSLRLVFERKVGDTGTLFGSVTNQDITEQLAEKKVEIDRRIIQLKQPLKNLGEHEVNVKLHHKVQAKLTVVVESDQPLPEPPPPPKEEAPKDDTEQAADNEATAEGAEATTTEETTEA